MQFLNDDFIYEVEKTTDSHPSLCENVIPL